MGSRRRDLTDSPIFHSEPGQRHVRCERDRLSSGGGVGARGKSQIHDLSHVARSYVPPAAPRWTRTRLPPPSRCRSRAASLKPRRNPPRAGPSLRSHRWDPTFPCEPSSSVCSIPSPSATSSMAGGSVGSAVGTAVTYSSSSWSRPLRWTTLPAQNGSSEEKPPPVSDSWRRLLVGIPYLVRL